MLLVHLLREFKEDVRKFKKDVREFKEDVREHKEDVRALKDDLSLLKNRIDMLDPKCGEHKTLETTLENPFEILRSFGFRADSLEEVSELLHNGRIQVAYMLYGH